MKRTVLVAISILGVMLGGAIPMANASVSGDSLPCAKPDGRVSAIAIAGGTAYLGGTFSRVQDLAGNSQPRQGLAAVDTASCDLLPWAPQADGEVDAIQAVGATLYVGGAFTHVNGASRPRLAAVDAGTGAVQAFNPSVNDTVHALAANPTTLFVGGDFTTVDGKSQPRLVAFSLSTGALKVGWGPTPSLPVNALAMSPDEGDLYVGGKFTSLGGDPDSAYLAAVDTSSGAVSTGFQPAEPYPVMGLAADGRGVYVGDGGPGGHVVLYNTDGSLQHPVYQTDGGVQAVAVGSDAVYAGGHFDNYCVGNTGSGSPFLCDTNQRRKKLMGISLPDGAVTDLAPEFDSAHGVFAAQVDPSTGNLWVGGDFTKIGAASVPHLAVFSGSGGTQTVPSAPQNLSATAGDSTVQLAWNPPANAGGSAVTSYRVYRATGGGQLTQVGTSTSTSYTDGTVTNGTTYGYAVTAVNATGEGPQSNQVSATPQGGVTTAPSAPRSVSATAGAMVSHLSWSPPSTDGGSAVTGYTIYRSTTSGGETQLATVAAGATSYDDTAVTAGTRYYYQVSASNAVGAGQRSAEVSDTPTGTASGGPCGTKVGAPVTINHVVMITFENKIRNQVIGAPQAPYLNSLANECGQATQMYALSSTSLANYIALTSGYTGYPNEITSNRSPSVWPQNTVSLFEQLGTDSRELSETAPSNCWTGSTPSLFAVNHTPLPYYTRIPDLCRTQDVPLGATPDMSAKFTLITPNKKDIMHSDGTADSKTRAQQVANGDQWASTEVPKVLSSPQYQAGDTVVIIVWDEGGTASENVPYIVLSPYTPVGYTTSVRMDHYSTLKGVEQIFGLGLLGHAATSSTSIRDYFGLS